MAYFLYILYSKTGDRYYTGSSDDPGRRLANHNTTEKGFTSRYRPWRIVFTKEYTDKKSAQAAERKVKSWKSKKMIEKLLRGELSL
jgi:predicted GIY-YIG superfamily endonuclease